MKWSRFSNCFIEKRGSSYAQSPAISDFQELYRMSVFSKPLKCKTNIFTRVRYLNTAF